jgi:predicted GNAT superfamily acetyltransferase
VSGDVDAREVPAGEVEVREIDRTADLLAASLLLARIWDSRPGEVMPVNLLKALAHTGHYVAGAWAGDELVGASAAWTSGPARQTTLHSHITGVLPAAQGGGIGFALKLHQAAWSRARGIHTVTWTFDPLIRRNGRFNLSRLGAVAVAYHPDFYGEMPDGINAGDPSDRCFVEWDVTRDPVPAAPGGPGGMAGPGYEMAEAAVRLRVGAGDRPEVDDPPAGWDGPLLCQVPDDALALRRRDPSLGLEWRLALRATMGAALATGYASTDVTDDGFYLLEKREMLMNRRPA